MRSVIAASEERPRNEASSPIPGSIYGQSDQRRLMLIAVNQIFFVCLQSALLYETNRAPLTQNKETIQAVRVHWTPGETGSLTDSQLGVIYQAVNGESLITRLKWEKSFITGLERAGATLFNCASRPRSRTNLKMMSVIRRRTGGRADGWAGDVDLVIFPARSSFWPAETLLSQNASRARWPWRIMQKRRATDGTRRGRRTKSPPHVTHRSLGNRIRRGN